MYSVYGLRFRVHGTSGTILTFLTGVIILLITGVEVSAQL